MCARAELLAGSIPVAQMVVMNGTAHVPSMEKPEEFNRLCWSFSAGGRVGGALREAPLHEPPLRSQGVGDDERRGLEEEAMRIRRSLISTSRPLAMLSRTFEEGSFSPRSISAR